MSATTHRLAALAMLIVLQHPATAAEPPLPADAPDVVVVGAGIAGLCTALEAARHGLSVQVVDMWSVFGGHAVMATGGVCIVGTAFQEQKGIADSPALARRDVLAWGEDNNVPWVDYYVEHSRVELYDWLVAQGVQFEGFLKPPGNSVPRMHIPKDRGIGLVVPLYQQCLHEPLIAFRWNTRVDALVVEQGRVSGVKGVAIRTGTAVAWRARLAVVIATGGFQSNLAWVQENWPQGQPFPQRLLIGSGINARGSGLDLARSVGAAVSRLDHQWNYPTGLPDPRYPDGTRGIHARNPNAIWLDLDGQRFTNEVSGPKFTLPAVLRVRQTTYFMLFDQAGRKDLLVAGSDFTNPEKIQKLLYDNPALMKSAPTLAGLATAWGLPPAAVEGAVARYNAAIDAGDDADFKRFEPGGAAPPQRIATPPFYAAQFFPVTRKSMGGIRVDLDCRVLDAGQQPIANLYAVGEVTGQGGFNGKAALEGTFLGPAILQGRLAGRAIAALPGAAPHALPPAPAVVVADPAAVRTPQAACLVCHDLATLVGAQRTGFQHFERVHTVVLRDALACSACHAELSPYQPGRHTIDRLNQSTVCRTCHVGKD